MDAEEEHEPCGSKDCELCTDDDDKIRVSVSPRRFTLPPTSEKRTKMEIKNKNPYPIYFKAGTSNMDAFRPQPNTGKIPPNSKVSVVVQFFDSVTPIRMHEEVVVMTSVRPFDQYSVFKDNVCPYCSEPVYLSKHQHMTNISNSREHTDDTEGGHYFNESKHPKYTILDCKDGPNNNEKVFERKHSLVSEKEMKPTDTYFQKRFEHPEMVLKQEERPQNENGNHHVRKTSHTHASGKLELEEICLHAFIHRPSNGSCACNNCAALSAFTKGIKIQEIRSGKSLKEKTFSDPVVTSTAEPAGSGMRTIAESKIKKDTVREKYDDRKGSKEKAREAHILARVKRSDESKESSDTEVTPSETSSKDVKRKRKIISEGDFKKKLQKAKLKKHQKQLEEESKSTTTTEGVTIKGEERALKKKDYKTALTKKEKKSILKSIDAKCSRILNVTWTTCLLLLILLVLVLFSYAYFTFVCTSKDQLAIYQIPCFYQFFK